MWGTNRKDTSMNALIYLIYMVLNLYMWAIIISVIMNLLVQFNVINSRSPLVYTIGNFLHRITDPVLRPIRQLLPNLGGIDISPIVVILGLYFIRDLLFEILVR